MSLAQVTRLKDRPAARIRPILKWAGGKTQLLHAIIPRVPEHFGTYHEPFVGAGAVFFALVRQQRMGKAFLSDINAMLIDTYLAVRDDVDGVIHLLRQHQAAHGREYYYTVRAVDPECLSPAQRAAWLIYLNHTCYNGLYRVNRSGRFNVPLGRYSAPAICDADNLQAASELLQVARLTQRDFRLVLDEVAAGDFVYLDPPYHPLSPKSFTAYSDAGFTARDQADLHDVVAELTRRNVIVMLSNSDTGPIRSLYAAFRIEIVQATRAINRVSTQRGKIAELLIRNY